MERRIWIFTDPHLGHQKMVTACQRPENFTEKILTNLNTTVRSGDVVICLGDICMNQNGKWNELLMRSLPTESHKWLVRGNHDVKTISWYLSCGWNWVGDRMDLSIYGFKVAFSHRPLLYDGTWDKNIHGHFHITNHHPEDNEGRTEHHILVYPEHHYMPQTLRSILGK